MEIKSTLELREYHGYLPKMLWELRINYGDLHIGRFWPKAIMEVIEKNSIYTINSMIKADIPMDKYDELASWDPKVWKKYWLEYIGIKNPFTTK